MTELSKKLTMTHLKSDEELRQDVEEHVEVEAKKEDKKDPKIKEVYVFPFKYTTPSGKVYSATFSNSILSIGEKMNVSALESTFNAGQPYDSIQPIQQIINRGIAHMTFSLKKRENQIPKGWADNLRMLKDEDLVLALFGEVSAHEGTFHGRNTPEEGSTGEEGDA